MKTKTDQLGYPTHHMSWAKAGSDAVNVPWMSWYIEEIRLPNLFIYVYMKEHLMIFEPCQNSEKDCRRLSTSGDYSTTRRRHSTIPYRGSCREGYRANGNKINLLVVFFWNCFRWSIDRKNYGRRLTPLKNVRPLNKSNETAMNALCRRFVLCCGNALHEVVMATWSVVPLWVFR